MSLLSKEEHEEGKSPPWRGYGEGEGILMASHRLFSSSLSLPAKVKVQGDFKDTLGTPEVPELSS